MGSKMCLCCKRGVGERLGYSDVAGEGIKMVAQLFFVCL